MFGIVTRKHKNNNVLINANNYALALTATIGRKTCSDLAKTVGKPHDFMQRKLNSLAENSIEIEGFLFENALIQNKKSPGYLVVDHTTIIKDYAKQIEGVMLQYSSKGIRPGIGMSGIVLVNKEKIVPVSLSVWKKGDRSKTVTAMDKVINLSQRLNAEGVLADGAFASIESLTKCIDAGIVSVMRFHSNRKVEVNGFKGQWRVDEHPAFKIKKNQRCIVKQVQWHGLRLCVIALKVQHKIKGWIQLFLVTTATLKKARTITNIYKLRWKIEVFFRTIKQKLGLGDCQARSLSKQKAHYLAVFFAYTGMDHHNKHYTNSESYDQIIKLNRHSTRKTLASQIFC